MGRHRGGLGAATPPHDRPLLASHRLVQRRLQRGPHEPDYGTHDWIAEHALDWLPAAEKKHLVDNLVVYLYGTELPDNGGAPDGIGDQFLHHVYYYSDGSLQDDASAVRW